MPQTQEKFDQTCGYKVKRALFAVNGVIQGERGPVTILLMPYEKISGPQSIQGENVTGVILPIGDGSIAIIGVEGERLERIEEQIENSVTWST